MDAALAETKERLGRERDRVIRKYGDMSDNEVMRVLRVEDEQAECLRCSGVCVKDFFRYKTPIATVVDGLVYVTNAPCVFGIDHELRRQCLKAHVPERFVGRDLSDYRVTSDNGRAVKIAKYICDNKPARGMFMYGATGTGKTFLAALIAMSYLRDGRRVKFFDMPGLLDRIKSTFDAKESTADFVDEICTADLLILDDMGAEKVTEWSVEQLYLIVNRRYNANRPLVATSNFDFNGLNRRLGGDNTSQRIVSRLQEMCAEAFFGTIDRRISK